MELWQQPDTQRALAWIGLHWDSIASTIFGGIALCVLAVIMRTRPLHSTSLREMPTYYKVENVVVNHVYNIWCQSKHERQEFVVLAVRGDWFLVGVFPRQHPHTYKMFEYHGWAGLLSSSQHITGDMLEEHHPDETRFAGRGWSLLATFS